MLGLSAVPDSGESEAESGVGLLLSGPAESPFVGRETRLVVVGAGAEIAAATESACAGPLPRRFDKKFSQSTRIGVALKIDE